MVDSSDDASVREALRALREATRRAALESPGKSEPALRQALARNQPPAELAELVKKIRAHAYKVTDEEIAALKSKYGEDAAFELVIAAVLGAAGDRLAAAERALEGA